MLTRLGLFYAQRLGNRVHRMDIITFLSWEFFFFSLGLIKNESFQKRSIWAINGTPTGITTLDQNGPGGNDIERGLYNPQMLRIEALPSDAV